MDPRVRAIVRSLRSGYVAGLAVLGAIEVLVCLVIVPVAGLTLMVLAPLLGLGAVRALTAWRCRDVRTESAEGLEALEQWLRRQPRPR
jgi:hypothetical protein